VGGFGGFITMHEFLTELQDFVDVNDFLGHKNYRPGTVREGNAKQIYYWGRLQV